MVVVMMMVLMVILVVVMMIDVMGIPDKHGYGGIEGVETEGCWMDFVSHFNLKIMVSTRFVRNIFCQVRL